MTLTQKQLAGLFSSRSCEWETPQGLFDALDAEFAFKLDVCATACNAKCEKWFGMEQDGLKQEWTGACWMNPPYGRAIGRWMKKAYSSSLRGATVVCLVPARTDTAWWWDYCMKGEIRFIRGRVKFSKPGREPAPATFPSAIVVLRPPAKTIA